MFSNILLDDRIFPGYHLSDGIKWLKNLNTINILIGSNNSGKSRFMRTLFYNDDYKFKSDFYDLDLLNNSYDKTLELLSNSILYKDTEIYGLLKKLNRIDGISKTDKSVSNSVLINDLLNRLSGSSSWNNKQLVNDLVKMLNEFEKLNVNIFSSFLKLYIPTLRGAIPLQLKEDSDVIFVNERNNYLQRNYKNYFDKKRVAENRIFTGLDLYERTQSLLLGDSKDREKIRKFEEFLSESFFQNQVVNIVPRKNHDVLHMKIGNAEHPIYDLGDGIQSVIILTYPLFFSDDKPTVFFIEEPETHLHPGLQRVFIETLLRPEFSKFQYFLTTHSNHFLDITLDYNNISVYTFSKDHTSQDNLFHINNVSSGDSNTLELLGVRNSSVFLSNCTIWVEGITDRLYLRKYLQLYQDNLGKIKYKEDYHFSFVEYGGNNITHWSFLDSVDENEPNINVDALCGKLFLITDKDNAGLKKNGEPNSSSSRKQLRHVALKAKLEERYHCIESREIENILSKDVVKKVILSYVDNVNIDFSKFDKGNYANEYLGNYIDSKIENLGRSFQSKSGTINDKVNFCRKAIEHLNSFDDMTKEAKELAHKIYNYIESNNV